MVCAGLNRAAEQVTVEQLLQRRKKGLWRDGERELEREAVGRKAWT